MKADVTSDNLLAKDLGPFIGARPGGQKASRRPDTVQRADGKVLPNKEIELGRLKAMDADVAFKANHIEIPVLPFDRLETKLTLDKGTLRLQPAIIRVGHGTVRTYLTLYGSETPVRSTSIADRASRYQRVSTRRVPSPRKPAAHSEGGRSCAQPAHPWPKFWAPPMVTCLW